MANSKIKECKERWTSLHFSRSFTTNRDMSNNFDVKQGILWWDRCDIRSSSINIYKSDFSFLCQSNFWYCQCTNLYIQVGSVCREKKNGFLCLLPMTFKRILILTFWMSHYTPPKARSMPSDTWKQKNCIYFFWKVIKQNNEEHVFDYGKEGEPTEP